MTYAAIPKKYRLVVWKRDPKIKNVCSHKKPVVLSVATCHE